MKQSEMIFIFVITAVALVNFIAIIVSIGVYCLS